MRNCGADAAVDDKISADFCESGGSTGHLQRPQCIKEGRSWQSWPLGSVVSHRDQRGLLAR